MVGLRGVAAAAMAAGFIVKRLLLVCLLSEVAHDFIFVRVAGSETQPWRSSQSPYHNWKQSSQNVHNRMPPQNAQTVPWLSLLEDVVKTYGQRDSDNQKPPQTPQQRLRPSHQQAVSNPYQQPHHGPVKRPAEPLPSQDHPALSPEKAKTSLNLPLHYFQMFKDVGKTNKGTDGMRVSGNDGAGSRYRLYPEGSAKDPLISKLDLALSKSAPILSLLQEQYRRAGSPLFLDDLQPAKKQPPQFRPDWILLQQGPGPQHPPKSPGHSQPQKTYSGCPMGHHCQVQIKHQPVFHRIPGQSYHPLTKPWPEQVPIRWASHPTSHRSPCSPRTQPWLNYPARTYIRDASHCCRNTYPMGFHRPSGRTFQNEPLLQVQQLPRCP